MLPTVAAVLFYLIAAALLVRGVARGADGRIWKIPATIALIAHAWLHVEAWHSGGAPDMHFFAALSLVALAMAALTTLLGTRQRIDAIGVVVFPLAALFAACYSLYGHPQPPAMTWQVQLHAWLALLAYATLAVAALLAALLWLQERAMRNREFHGWMRALPPLTELESLLFRTLTVGFLLLSAAILAGVLFVGNLFQQHLVHKTVLSLLSWLIFATLLFGRWRWGWRGARAVRWTLVAMAILLLAFFGSQFVLELILKRT
ncbi:cytochrome C assembly family protein [Solilutibacter silvestris]|uniref:ABC-type putative transport system permease component-related protein n=1 Tax=Solilutibacter silvestris TaxID=1645665 RepID=A0A2K1PYF9_9GAMM|nr:cytochrome c biogenesis protein CcsA [Lysobacter silvestris]PNS07717.1 ABC-type putative transport system permease component-related protein [Lysobacter silvestris]